MRLDAFPRHPLTFGPSPVHPLERLTTELGGATLWAKRDDCNSGLAYGGNKTRKLEYLVADALAKGCDTLVSIGGVQSNHTRQVAAAAARVAACGCVLVQESWVDWPDVVYDRVGNIQLSRIMGADVRLVQAGFGIGFKESWEQALADVEARGRQAVRDPGGRLGPPARRPRLRALGARGRAEQERELGVFFDTIVVCSVTGSTQAGMIAGFAGQERPRRVLGIDGSAKPAETHAQVARHRPRDRRADRAGPRRCATTRSCSTTATTPAPTGSRTSRRSTAIRLAGRLEGMITDPVYEGKSMAGMIDLVARGEIARDSNVLYAHLGGQPALSAYGALFR